MDTSSLPERRVSRRTSGFTLLEVMFAIIVMNVLVTVTARQILAQNTLVDTLEEWCVDDPIYVVAPAVDPIYRASEVPPDLFQVDAKGKVVLDLASGKLKLKKVKGDWIDEVNTGYDLEITAVKRDLASMTTKASVVQSGTYRTESGGGEEDDD